MMIIKMSLKEDQEKVIHQVLLLKVTIPNFKLNEHHKKKQTNKKYSWNTVLSLDLELIFFYHGKHIAYVCVRVALIMPSHFLTTFGWGSL